MCAFNQLNDSIEKYSKVILYYNEENDYPEGIYLASTKYMSTIDVEFEVKTEFDEEDLKKGTLFFTIGDNDLWELLRVAKSKNYEIGKHFGVLSHNDSLVKEIIQGGITTFSTDFKQMAVHAAMFIKDENHLNKIVPSELIIRNSI